MKADILIQGGHVIDPERNVDTVCDVAVLNGKIVGIGENERVEASYTVKADGLLVVPGLIDYHEHINYRSTDVGIPPDVATLPKGVTTVVDCGSSGATNCRAFLDRLSQCLVKTRIYIHISPLGLATKQFYEPMTPEKWDMGKLEMAFDEGGERIRGIKMRVSDYVLREAGMTPFYEMLKVARSFHKGVYIHPTDAPAKQAEILDNLCAGDVYGHVFQGKNDNNILNQRKVIPQAWDARERGVLFDVAHGGGNFSFDIAERAMGEGFFPDIISSDMTIQTWNRQPLCSLTQVMSKFLMLGMTMPEIIRAVTATPARALNMSGRVGTLAPGACGDVTLLSLERGEFDFVDVLGKHRRGETLLVPKATFANGMLVYREPVFAAAL